MPRADPVDCGHLAKTARRHGKSIVTLLDEIEFVNEGVDTACQEVLHEWGGTMFKLTAICQTLYYSMGTFAR